MKKTIIITDFLLILLLICNIIPVNAREPVYNEITRDYRPYYANFSYDVFKYLPPFPQDFWTRKDLFDTQQVQADRLTSDYYLQPEILPNWFDWCDQIYGSHDKNLTGVYGIAVYPSLFNIYNIGVNETALVSALIYTTFGVEIYQGTRLVPKYNESNLDVELISPTDTFLLAPTYPEFDSSWCNVISFKITVLQPGNNTVEIWEEKPPEYKDSYWKEYYGIKYISGGSILGLRIPKMKIRVYGPINSIQDDNNPKHSLFNDNIWFFVLFLISVGLLICGVYVRHRKRKTKET